jgi:hypothetical protein
VITLDFPMSDTPHFLSFILDDHRYEATFMASPASAQALFQRLDLESRHLENRGASSTAALLNLQDLQVGTLTLGHDDATNAKKFLTYVVEEGLNQQMADALAEAPALAQLVATAQTLDTACVTATQQGAEPLYLAVAFTWENGGGDDNAFHWTVQGTKDQETAMYAFVAQFESWLTDESHGYDLTVGEDAGEAPKASLREALRDLVGTLEENYPPQHKDPYAVTVGQAWTQALREALNDLPAPEAKRRQRLR